MPKPKGYTRSRNGYRAWVRVGKLPPVYKRFKESEKDQIKAWRITTKADLTKQLKREAAPDPGTLSADFARYLTLVAAMPTIAQRTDHLNMWIEALGGHRQRSTITRDHIRAVLQQWRKDGLAPATCNKRRTALMHVWSELDGKDARNPVRGVPKFRPDDPLPRGRDRHAVDAMLLKAPRCKSRACARVMLWTGMRPIELERSRPDDTDLKHRITIVRTGKGGRTRTVPLTPQAVAAWKEFEAVGCWKEPDNTPRLTKKKKHPKRQREHRIPQASPMGRFIKKYTGMKDLRVYDMRHSYGTGLARGRTRLDAIGTLMGHSTLDLTRRYTLAAVEEEALKATVRLGRRPGGAAKKLPAKVAQAKRTNKRRVKAA